MMQMRAHLDRMRLMQEEAEAALRFIYSGSESTLRRLQTLCNPERTFDMDAIERFEEKERELAAIRSNTTARHRAEAEARRRSAGQWRGHSADTGSSAVQAAFATERIKQLTAHLLRNKHDESAKRGLHALVTLRRKNLEYLYKQDPQQAVRVASGLGVRFSPPGRHLFDRAVKYAAFHNTRARDAAVLRRARARARRLARQGAAPAPPPSRPAEGGGGSV
jgi:small subunit ribosomal protein S15